MTQHDLDLLQADLTMGCHIDPQTVQKLLDAYYANDRDALEQSYEDGYEEGWAAGYSEAEDELR